MLIERIFDEDLSQAGYLVGCQATGEAVVVDARRDIDHLLGLAARHSMTISAVTETHIHADYLSGTRELAAATGATAYVSGEGGAHWQYGFEAERLHDGDEIQVGRVTVCAVHTPGHTPEHLSFLVTDGARSTEPGYLLSGDFVFAGDLGRPDLLDEVAGEVDSRYGGARQIYASLQRSFLTLPDHVQVFPGHGSGSACGKALGALPSTTVGYERRTAWWSHHLEADDEQGFVDELLDGQPDAHAYFGRMKRQNRQGPTLLGPLPPLRRFDTPELLHGMESGELVVVDTRDKDAVLGGTVAGSLAIPAPERAAHFGSWAVDPERDTARMVVLAPHEAAATEMRDHLVRVGIDSVVGYVTGVDDLPTYTPEQIAPEDLQSYARALLLDVRSVSEHAAGHIPGSRQCSAGRVLWSLDSLPHDGPIVTYCQSGVRNSVVSSALRRAGFHVVEVDGSYAAWADQKAQPARHPETV